MSYTEPCPNPTKQPLLSRLLPYLKKLKNLRLFRLIPEMRDCGIVAPGFNVTWKTNPASIYLA